MDFGLAFSFVFQDKDWFKKVGIAGLITLIPIIGQLILVGWGLKITKNVMDRNPTPLPDVEFGEDLGRGFFAFVIGFVYSLPLSILSGIFAGINAAASAAMYDSGEGAGLAIVTLFSVCFSLFAGLYGLLLAVVLPAAYCRYLDKGSLGEAFKLGEVFKLVKAAPGAYLLVIVGALVAGLIAPLGSIACIIGVVVTAAFAMALNSHLYGQAYNEANKNLGFVVSN